MKMRMIAQITFRTSQRNAYDLHIRLIDNEITYTIGNQSLSNFFDQGRLQHIYHGESPQEIGRQAIEAFRYTVEIQKTDYADATDD